MKDDKNKKVNDGQGSKAPRSLEGGVSKGYVLSQEEISAEDCLRMLRRINDVFLKYKGSVN